MWTVIYIAKNKKSAERTQELLAQEGMLAKIQPINKSADKKDGYYEVLVPEGEAEDAQNIIYEAGL
ncbi:hypothetical protein [Lutispora thermophila]|mgnify:CR=1 FL=1|uniref:Signal transducing protein n=1 Tax=Lutispora thermophila DSM 19022 TaxID=1122184 RepID=A0A1M6I9F8_9FIRM|nr:hypothetical protein [Lutispora thermophila]SHJ31026.1 hypothetical protein SAMN02745176_03144 [Lutispora thermophila DSM 19022]